ncbi:YceI family protein [Lacinutrix jangbogonensis]|uniref:YceI family protein n=1 Tax=Lacinutrix jangbogonensis TaxID=1469557 RepID=UPI00053CFF9C|nr:YceI family protein [Lacinutrix jangbogonensis]
MRKQVLNIFTVLALGLAVVGCKKGTEAETTDAKEVVEVEVEAKYKAIPEKSMIIWKANKIVGGHSGTINVSNGVAKTKGNQLVGGSFIFDIATLKNTDIEDAVQKGKLEGHLKADDFFDVEKHPNASFEITSVENGKISGNLMMKGIKKNVTVPVTVGMTGDMMTITSDVFTIDRTEWNIKYNSGKFADPAKLGDYMIKDDVELKISITAKKA